MLIRLFQILCIPKNNFIIILPYIKDHYIIQQMSEEAYGEVQKDKSIAGNSRQFGCPCGKTYLSYPALFTHVKQKHDGKPPGTLVKPKTQKARGRPKIHIEIPEDDMSDGAFNLEQQVETILSDYNIDYNEPFQMSQGNKSCQDMASQFLNKLNELDSNLVTVLKCFFHYLQFYANKKTGMNFWKQKKPTDLIDIVNDMSKQHEKYANLYPISKQILMNLIYLLFRWMYKTKWTDHKLIMRAPAKKLIKYETL